MRLVFAVCRAFAGLYRTGLGPIGVALSLLPVVSNQAEELFDTNRVQEISIHLAAPDWNVLRFQHRESEFFPEEGKAATNAYTWFPATVVLDGRRFDHARVRKKGYIGSNDPQRPALKLRLNISAPEGKEEAIELTLNNNRQDPSLIRQYLAYEIFRRAAVPAPRCSFARVSVNGTALGVYTHVESINAAFLKRNFGRANGSLYEGGRSDFRSGWFQNFEVKQPGPGKPRADLEEATLALERTNQPLFTVANRYLDLPEFLRFWAVESLIGAGDGYAANANNFFVYHNPDTDRFAFIPWGADTVLYPGGGRPSSVIAVGILAYRLYTSQEGREAYRAALRQVLDRAWTEDLLLHEIDRLERLLGTVSSTETGQLHEQFESIRNVVRTRRSQIEPELVGSFPELKTHPLELAKRRNVGHLEATFTTSWHAIDPSQPLGRGQATLTGDLFKQPLRCSTVGSQAGAFSGFGSDVQPTISIAGTQPDQGNGFLLFLTVAPELYAPDTTLPVDNTHVFGVLVETDGQGRSSGMFGMLRGSLKLRAAGHQEGEPVTGQLSADVFSKLPRLKHSASGTPK